MSKSVKNTLKTDFSSSKTAEILLGLTKKEYKRFGLFLRSPFFNKSKTSCELYDYFKEKKDTPAFGRITKEVISAHLFPGEKYDDITFRKHLSNFNKLAEEFLVQCELEGNKLIKENMLLRTASQRGLPVTFEAKLKDLRNEYESCPDKSHDEYYYIYQTERSYFHYSSRSFRNPEQETQRNTYLLDLYYISVKLLHFYTILNLRLHYNKQVELDQWAFDNIVKFIENNREELAENHKPLYIDYLSVKMLLAPDNPAGFNELRDFIKSSDVHGTTEERAYIYLYNHSLYRFNKGFTDTPREVFGTMRLMEERNMPMWNYFAYHMYYVNAVKYAAMAGDFEWAEKFMEKRRERLHDDIVNEADNLARAGLYFYKKNYKKALEHLINVDYPNYSFYLHAKSLLIKIYYEERDFIGVMNTVETTKKFLTRKDLIPDRLISSNNKFLNVVSKMIDVRTKNDIADIEKTLNDDKSILNRDWILEKLAGEVVK